jgi:hypothetical protein
MARWERFGFSACRGADGAVWVERRYRVGMSEDDLPVVTFATQGGRDAQVDRLDIRAVANPYLPVFQVKQANELGGGVLCDPVDADELAVAEAR